MLSMMRFYHEQIDRRKELYSSPHKSSIIIDDERDEDNCVKVLDRETGMIFKSIKACAAFCHVSSRKVQRDLSNPASRWTRDLTKGKWNKTHWRSQAVRHVPTGEVYISLAEAVEKTGVTIGHIRYHLEGLSKGKVLWERI